MASLDQNRRADRIRLRVTVQERLKGPGNRVLKQPAAPRPDLSAAADAHPWRVARNWWGALRFRRKAGFCAGLVMYFGSYEYIHDFGVKHPYPAFVGVLLMIISGGIGID